MLFLLFQLGQDRYAIEARKIVEVLPLMRLKQLPHAPRGVGGILNYRGKPIPAIDLCALALGRPAKERLTTRILVVQSSCGRCLGLIAEHANETMIREPQEFMEGGVTVDGAPYLGLVTQGRGGLVQWVDPERLLSDDVREALFQQAAEAA
jgi:chemotaxis-related protein WspB